MTNRPNQLLRSIGFYAAVLVCLAALGIGTYRLLLPSPAAVPAADGKSAGAAASAAAAALRPPVPAAEAHASPTPPPAAGAGEEDEEDAPVLTADTVDQTPVAALAPALVVAPLQGEVVAAFSVDQLQYSATLDDWRTHDGIDIAADAGTKVLAAAAGTVLKAESDDLMGTTVVLSHADGVQTTYANLESVPAVKKGQTVSAGQVLGAVGLTALSERAEGPHLHFSVARNGDAVNPEQFLNSGG